MKVLAFLSQKGGTGKTTLCVHVAVAAQETGLKVLIVDTDPQRSATIWGDARDAEAPMIAAVAVADLPRVLKAAKTEGVDLVVVDTAPHAAPEASKIARMVDRVIIPCRPTAFDLAAAEGAARIVKAAKVKSAFVLSACPFRAPEVREARKALGDHRIPVSPVEITDRRAFARAIATGRAVTEFETDGKAAVEIRNLWKWTRTTL